MNTTNNQKTNNLTADYSEFTIETTYSKPKLVSTLTIPLDIMQNSTHSKAEKLTILINNWAEKAGCKTKFAITHKYSNVFTAYKIYAIFIADNEEYREVITDTEHTILLYTLQESFNLIQK